ncbi:XRE family transcriptional regulator [Kutzneria chonburiensis]|uniref:XRE family transcriptional regulator n=1 Tax=Kutzneria chonburiensis TaxID=1483604 RepID=A0ABV6N6R7_9PSEU|nr:XRE family transcriptional regulator [Kutzneria chonburiensis]
MLPTNDRELRRLLRHGTFAQALDRAMTVRGLSLDRVQQHLAARDVRVSRAALSYWRRGRSRPERTESLRAIRALEDLLGLPAESLVALLGPPRPRGRTVGSEAASVDRRRLWTACGPLLADISAPPEGQVRYLAVHEHVSVDGDRYLRSVRTRLVLEAAVDRVDRCVVYQWAEDPVRPSLDGLAYCRPGRIRVDASNAAMVCELLLEQRLGAGERTVVEYGFTYPAGLPLTSYDRRFTRASRQYLLQVAFNDDVPASCMPYHQAAPGAPRHVEGPLWLGASATAHLVVPDAGPGIVGLRWEWGERAAAAS